MHNLLTKNLDAYNDLDSFFNDYFGHDVLSEINEGPVEFYKWPVGARQALRSLCIHIARDIPEADHVIRHDVKTRRHLPEGVPGELFMYFGIQFNDTAKRGQFLGVSYEKDQEKFNLRLFIAGSERVEIRRELMRLEDPDNILSNRKICDMDDIVSIEKSLASMASIQRVTIRKEKRTFGFNPLFCWARMDKERLSSAKAGEIYFQYYLERKKNLSAPEMEIEIDLLTANNSYRKEKAINYIRDHLDVEAAYKLALSEHS
jgi:hypothetical protein